MAIVQISRIQHRRGVSDNLPQLAVGELGLAVDTRRIYIGNGGTDAPQIENIELLTAQSNLLDSADSYTYAGSAAGYDAITGLTAAAPTTRTMQAKFDEFASVKDFGAKGDGNTDDTVAINRALSELYTRATNTEIRRALYFPAGVYPVSDVLKIPTFAKLVGEGHNSSIIKGTSSSPDCVAMTSDSLQQIDGSVGTGGATSPGDVNVDGLTFHASVDNLDAFVVNQAQTVTFTNCRFQGFNTSVPTGVGNSQTAFKIESSATRQTEHIHCVGCSFSGANFLVNADHDMSSITFSGCEFLTAFKGFKVGENKSGSAPSVVGPRGMKVTNSLFDNIYDRGIHLYDGPGFSSAFNTFKDVANNNLGTGNPSTHVIEFAADDSQSIGDAFERPDGDVVSTKRRVSADTSKKTSFAIESSGVKFGGYVRDYGQVETLDDNSTKDSTISFADNTDFAAIEIDYYITRGTTKRQGMLRITHDATAQVIDDDFSENNGSVGVTFNLTNSSNVTKLRYTTTSTGAAATFNRSIRIIR